MAHSLLKKPNHTIAILLLVLFFQTISCSTSEVNEEPNEMESSDENEAPEAEEESADKNTTFVYILSYMDYPSGVFFPDQSEKISIIQNDEGQITQRLGGVYNANVDPAAGVSYFFDEMIVDQVTYTDNQIIVEKVSEDEAIPIPVFKRTFILDQDNNISQKIVETSDPVSIDTLDFEYNGNGKISKMTNRSLTLPKETSFYYNNNQNIDSIVTVEIDVESDITTTTLERFDNYDTSENPIQEFSIFEELFYRSLSRNNYSRYWFQVETLRPGGRSFFGSAFIDWDFKYDPDGNILFDE